MHQDFRIYISQVGSVDVSDASGEPKINVVGNGEAGARKGISSDGQLVPAGFIAIPDEPGKDANGNPDPTSTTPVLVIEIGDQTFTMPITDPRDLAKLPNHQPGDRGFVAANGTFVRARKDGTISLFTTDDKTVNGKSVYYRIEPGSFLEVAPWGKRAFDAWSWRVDHASGAHISAGGFSGGPLGPMSTVTMSADHIELDSAQISLGAAPTDKVAKVLPLVQLLTALSTTPAAVGKPPLDPATAATLIAQLQECGVAI